MGQGDWVKFAEFDEQQPGDRWPDARVRALERRDLQEVADIYAEREGVETSRAIEVASRWADVSSNHMVLVAERNTRVWGYGKAEWLDPRAHGGDAPVGWYLTGLVVAPPARRRGVGTVLTHSRLERLRSVTPEVWYFANVRNRATIALHERHGFVLHSRSFRIPGVAFEGGQGALFRLSMG